MNKGGVDQWLEKANKLGKKKILTLADNVPHNCCTCWWLQFKDGMPNRGCRYSDFNNGERLPVRMVPEACTWFCKAWRVDPEARSRIVGSQGFIM